MSVTKKKVSKKNKASWRKYSDIKDVEEFLEDQRLEERIGKVELKPDEELFQIDREGKTNVSLISRKGSRRQKVSKPLKCLVSLENTSKVQDPIAKRNHVRLRNNGKSFISKYSLGDSKNSGRRNSQRRKEDKVLEFCKDVWASDNDSTQNSPLDNEWMGSELVSYHSFNTGKRMVPRPKTADLKTTKAGKIEFPHPGMSYNPSLKDHQDLMDQVLENESKIIKEEQHLKRVTTDMFSKISASECENQNLKGFSDTEEPEDEKTFDPKKSAGLFDSFSINPPVQNKKKALKKRRNERLERKLKQKKKELKLEKKKITDIHRLRAIKCEVEKEEEEQKKIKQRRKVTAAEKQKLPRRLAKLKYKEPNIPINSATDLCGNLRNLKTETNILEDQFKSLQKRNILPPSVDTGVRKRSKVKRFVRSSHKQRD